MRTEDLFLSLGNDVKPVARHAVERRIAFGMVGGGVVTIAAVLLHLGVRPDLSQAMVGFPFWMKWGYTISLGVIASVATIHLARPEATPPRWLAWLALPVVLLAVLALVEVLTTPAANREALWMGQSWQVCTMRVATFALPVFVGLVLAFRRLAPTHLRLTGAVAGLASGAVGATLYGLHCPEASALFVLVWYSLGIAAAAAIGALTGPKLLRW